MAKKTVISETTEAKYTGMDYMNTFFSNDGSEQKEATEPVKVEAVKQKVTKEPAKTTKPSKAKKTGAVKKTAEPVKVKKAGKKKVTKVEPEYKLNPAYIEKKTRRVDLLFKPSLYEKLQAQSRANNKSLNEYIHTLLEEATQEN